MTDTTNNPSAAESMVPRGNAGAVEATKVLSDICFTTFGSSVCRALLERNYDVRKKGAREIEEIVKFYLEKDLEGGPGKVSAVLKLLGSEFLKNQNKDARVGGLIAMAGAAIGLQATTKYHLELLIPPVVQCCRTSPSDSSIKYFAAESLFNILRVAPADSAEYLEDLAYVLLQLWTDDDRKLAKAAECMDPCLRNITDKFATADQIRSLAAVFLAAMPSTATTLIPGYMLNWLVFFFSRIENQNLKLKISLFIPKIFIFSVAPLNAESRKTLISLLMKSATLLAFMKTDDDENDVKSMFTILKTMNERRATPETVKLLSVLFIGLLTGSKCLPSGVLTCDAVTDCLKLHSSPNVPPELVAHRSFVIKHLPSILNLLFTLEETCATEQMQILMAIDSTLRSLCVSVSSQNESAEWMEHLAAVLTCELGKLRENSGPINSDSANKIDATKGALQWLKFIVSSTTASDSSSSLVVDLVLDLASHDSAVVRESSIPSLKALTSRDVQAFTVANAVLGRITNLTDGSVSDKVVIYTSVLDLILASHLSVASTLAAAFSSHKKQSLTDTTTAKSYELEHIAMMSLTLGLVFGSNSHNKAFFQQILNSVTEKDSTWYKHPAALLLLMAMTDNIVPSLMSLNKWAYEMSSKGRGTEVLAQLEVITFALEGPRFSNFRQQAVDLYKSLADILPIQSPAHSVALTRWNLLSTTKGSEQLMSSKSTDAINNVACPVSNYSPWTTNGVTMMPFNVFNQIALVHTNSHVVSNFYARFCLPLVNQTIMMSPSLIYKNSSKFQNQSSVNPFIPYSKNPPVSNREQNLFHNEQSTTVLSNNKFTPEDFQNVSCQMVDISPRDNVPLSTTASHAGFPQANFSASPVSHHVSQSHSPLSSSMKTSSPTPLTDSSSPSPSAVRKLSSSATAFKATINNSADDKERDVTTSQTANAMMNNNSSLRNSNMDVTANTAAVPSEVLRVLGAMQ